MLTKTIPHLMVLSISACISASALERRSSVPATTSTNALPIDTPGAVFSATEIYNTIINQSPYLTQATTIVTWTASSTPIASSTPAARI
ncbi:hypothetical protein PILCRDRAFT_829245 [Piloderma croceum F 1598]|uniref:Uncharacterized protein n=1 Tax=Piloderma croceum (strain F 1598) TaxID=765440 RepID=A0A0C3EXJ0_PILCF|nr:hypothetical protein PILCRDRAFT_829630 [Piloderma croceum F 1598]KIM73302.1 hypothetical protein PILCRDRAFT_829245 [Piloderma croceum F 1598]